MSLTSHLCEVVDNKEIEVRRADVVEIAIPQHRLSEPQHIEYQSATRERVVKDNDGTPRLMLVMTHPHNYV